jgi:alpha-glucosidase (family GH31 glycosyl hydrolase)
VVGRPHMPPFWALGFHQCRWGYANVDDVTTVVKKHREHGIPLEVMWTDIDCMRNVAVLFSLPFWGQVLRSIERSVVMCNLHSAVG